jgi:hypothetical protein
MIVTGLSKRSLFGCGLSCSVAVAVMGACSPAADDSQAQPLLPAGGAEMSSGGTSGSAMGPGGAAPVSPPVAGDSNSGPGDLFVDPNELPAAPSDTPAAQPVRRRGLLQKQVVCPEGGSTTVSGTVYIPSGELPVYNAAVYVPDADLKPLTQGVSCNCEVSGEPIASTLTDAAGHFVLSNVPVGDDIPIVVQVGDWRREFNVGTVAACAEKVIPDQTFRLPAKKSEGDIPRIAVATGQLDALECLVRKLGVDESEFTNPIDGGRVALFNGEYATESYVPELNAGGLFRPAEALYYDLASLSEFDIVLLSCNGPREIEPESLLAMADYLNAGGRVFASHFQSVWFEDGPAPFPELAQYDSQEDLRQVTGQVITSFPKGQAMAEWLVNAGAADQQGQLQINGAQHNIVVENPAYAQRWIETQEPVQTVQYLSANTPLGAPDEQQCGRLVLSDIHVSEGGTGDDISHRSLPFPQGCQSTSWSPQEAALAFMLFDISGCIVPDDQAPVAPPTVIR